MTQPELTAKLQELRPGASWAVTGSWLDAKYSDLRWFDKQQAKPTAEEIGL